jgi:hypothetical protein
MSNARTTTGPSTSPGNGDWKETMGRVGLVGRGVMYAVIGLLAIQLALGNSSQEASNSGAIEWIAQQPLGKFLLVALTISLFSLAAWRLLDAVVGDPVEGDEASDRAEYAIKGVVYAALAVGALSATIANWSGGGGGSGGSSCDSQNQEATATVLEWPAGQWIVTAVGLGIIGYAIYMFKKHVMDEEFLQRLSTSKDWVEKLGRGGYAARSAIFLVIGWFLTQAGLTHEAGETKGLSGALQEISGQAWGQLLLLAVAVGLLAFGLFSLAEAKYRRDA